MPEPQPRQNPGPPRLQRVPPSDPQLEANLLGAALLAGQAAAIAAALPPECWYTPKHQPVADAISELHHRGQPTDAGTVGAHLHQLGLLDSIGGYPALIAYAADCPQTTSAQAWATQLEQLHYRRRQLYLAGDLVELVYRGVPTSGLIAEMGDAANHLDQLTVSSWEQLNLAAVLAGDGPDLTPTILHRTDMRALLYPGKVHAINAEPEAGKSWLALHACHQQLTAGAHVIYIDFEADAADIVTRLLNMGAEPAQILDLFHYIRPDEPLDQAATQRVATLANTVHPTVAVIDGVTEALHLAGGSIKDNDDIARFYALLPRPLARCGPAVILIDHVTKDRNTRGKWGIGGEHKLAGTDGAVYSLETITPFAINQPGESRLIVTKDRHGQIRQHSTPGSKQIAGICRFDAHPDGTLDVTVTPDNGQAGRTTWDGPTHCRDAILELLSGMPGETVTQSELVARLKARGRSFRKQTVVVAAELLVEAGFLDGQRGTRNNSRVYQYRDDERAQDDLF